jgi:hypothetical protein
MSNINLSLQLHVSSALLIHPAASDKSSAAALCKHPSAAAHAGSKALKIPKGKQAFLKCVSLLEQYNARAAPAALPGESEFLH